MIKKLKGALRSKTMWFAALVAILSNLQGYVFAIPLSAKYQAIIGSILAALVAYLRIVTSESLDDK